MSGVGDIVDGFLAADDGAVRAALGQELTRLQAAEPAAALSLAPDASAEEIRGRFLTLAKVYHPNRFARRPPDIIKLANEVFLLLRRAYQRIGERRDRPTTGTVEVMSGTAAAGSAAIAARASELSPATQPRLDVEMALARRRRVRSRPVSPVPAGLVPTTPPPSGQPSSSAGAADAQERPRRRDEEQKERLDRAVRDLRKGRLSSAREALRALVAESPSERQFRAYLHYVTGRMHETAGRTSEAMVEYDRALGFDPDLAMARRSRDLITASPARGEPDGPGTGPFSRWFRK